MIREHVPDCAITTDIIVGFPGETEEDFRATLEVVEEVGYDSAFTFVFSPRRGTEAAKLPDQVPHAVKRERMERLVELVQRRALERCRRFVGTTQEVLVEGPSRTDPARLRGRTRHNKTVNFTGLAQPGELVEVEITGATSTTLAGEESPGAHAPLDRASSGPPASARPRSRSSWPTCCARGGGSRRRVRGRDRGLRGARRAGGQAGHRPARAPAGLVRADRGGVQRGAVRGAARTPRSTGCSPRGRRRSSSAAPACTCAPR